VFPCAAQRRTSKDIDSFSVDSKILRHRTLVRGSSLSIIHRLSFALFSEDSACFRFVFLAAAHGVSLAASDLRALDVPQPFILIWPPHAAPRSRHILSTSRSVLC
jgi:hypothetical protein